jgi:hypothetical protein
MGAAMRMKWLILLLLWAPLPASAACSNTDLLNGWTCVQSASGANGGSGTSYTQTLGTATTAENLVIIAADFCANSGCSSSPSGYTITPSNGATNTFYALIGCHSFTSQETCVWFVPSTSATTTWTVTTSPASYYLEEHVYEISPPSGKTISSSSDASGTGSGSGTSASVNTSGSTSNATDLAFGFIVVGGNPGTESAGTGYLSLEANNDMGIGKSLTATGTQTCPWNFTNSISWDGVCGAIAATGGVARPPTLPLMGVGDD